MLHPWDPLKTLAIPLMTAYGVFPPEPMTMLLAAGTTVAPAGPANPSTMLAALNAETLSTAPRLRLRVICTFLPFCQSRPATRCRSRPPLLHDHFYRITRNSQEVFP